MTRARDVASNGGLVTIIPGALQVGGGTASVSSNGKITLTNVTNLSVYDAFSSKYDNYRIIFGFTSASGGQDPVMGVGSATLHYWRKSQNETVSNANGAAGWNFMRSGPGGGGAVVDLINPFLASSPTFGLSRFADNDLFFGYSSLTKTADSNTYFTVTMGGITGSIRIYGYNNG
jgi:hypothetical protein